MTTTVPAAVLPETTPKLTNVLRQYFTDFDGFMETYIRQKHPPYFYLMMWLLGTERAIENIETSLLGDKVAQADYWPDAWLIIVVRAIVYGFLAYWLNGVWYHLRVLFCGGSKVGRTSLNINLYTGLPFYLTLLLLYVINTTLYGNAYFSEDFIPGIEAIPLMIIVTLAAMYSIRLSYRAVRKIQDTKKYPSIFWFIVLPVPYYILLAFAFVPA